MKNMLTLKIFIINVSNIIGNISSIIRKIWIFSINLSLNQFYWKNLYNFFYFSGSWHQNSPDNSEMLILVELGQNKLPKCKHLSMFQKSWNSANRMKGCIDLMNITKSPVKRGFVRKNKIRNRMLAISPY